MLCICVKKKKRCVSSAISKTEANKDSSHRDTNSTVLANLSRKQYIHHTRYKHIARTSHADSTHIPRTQHAHNTNIARKHQTHTARHVMHKTLHIPNTDTSVTPRTTRTQRAYITHVPCTQHSHTPIAHLEALVRSDYSEHQCHQLPHIGLTRRQYAGLSCIEMELTWKFPGILVAPQTPPALKYAEHEP